MTKVRYRIIQCYDPKNKFALLMDDKIVAYAETYFLAMLKIKEFGG